LTILFRLFGFIALKDYPQTVKLKAQPDPHCDPSQGFCEMWLPGNYTVKIGKLFSSSLFKGAIL
jgi:hypothetical protein